MESSRAEALCASAVSSYIEGKRGHRPNPATVFRWMQQERLYSFYIGRRRFTTRAAVDALLESFNRPAKQAADERRADVAAAGEAAAARIMSAED